MQDVTEFRFKGNYTKMKETKGIVVFYLRGVVMKIGGGGSDENNSIKRGDHEEIFLI